jgi:hypothetical protein
MKLYSLYKELILEVVSTSYLKDVMDNKKSIWIFYDANHIKNKGWRMVEIYALGISKGGNPVIRAYQNQGVTDTITPGWKFFRLDRITNWKDANVGYEPLTGDKTLFNRTGDKTMLRVDKIAQI